MESLTGTANTYAVRKESQQEALKLEAEGLLPGATMISFFLERIRRNVRSFWGSMSRTVLLAFIMKLCIRPAYCTVVELSTVLLIGIPAERHGKRGEIVNNGNLWD